MRFRFDGNPINDEDTPAQVSNKAFLIGLSVNFLVFFNCFMLMIHLSVSGWLFPVSFMYCTVAKLANTPLMIGGKNLAASIHCCRAEILLPKNVFDLFFR